ncbi:MAG TPA: phosphoribosyltransferase family protein [Vicingaceae bacterium]|jgi:pyrimidine operon attenuation protein/uracil phosphoribosyltransferase|nr:phosphoribosyltransferase family protein [Vicingaceae bacterium]
MPNSQKTKILTHDQITKKINRIAFQIYEDNHSEKEIVLVGIEKKGFLLAKKLTEKLQEISSIKIAATSLYVNKDNPLSETPRLSIDTKELDDKVIILVDDVLNSGKTLIYGVKYLLDFNIKRMSTVVLVDRNHKRYPIGTHYVGLSLSTTLKDHISIEFTNGKMTAYLS